MDENINWFLYWKIWSCEIVWRVGLLKMHFLSLLMFQKKLLFYYYKIKFWAFSLAKENVSSDANVRIFLRSSFINSHHCAHIMVLPNDKFSMESSKGIKKFKRRAAVALISKIYFYMFLFCSLWSHLRIFSRERALKCYEIEYGLFL